MCTVAVEFLAFDVLLNTKSEQQVTGNLFCSQKIFKTPLKTSFSIRNILLQFVSGVFGLNNQKTDF